MTRRTRTSRSVENRLDALEDERVDSEYDPPELTPEERQYLDEMFGGPERLDRYSMEDYEEFHEQLKRLNARDDTPRFE